MSWNDDYKSYLLLTADHYTFRRFDMWKHSVRYTMGVLQKWFANSIGDYYADSYIDKFIFYWIQALMFHKEYQAYFRRIYPGNLSQRIIKNLIGNTSVFTHWIKFIFTLSKNIVKVNTSCSNRTLTFNGHTATWRSSRINTWTTRIIATIHQTDPVVFQELMECPNIYYHLANCNFPTLIFHLIIRRWKELPAEKSRQETDFYLGHFFSPDRFFYDTIIVTIDNKRFNGFLLSKPYLKKWMPTIKVKTWLQTCFHSETKKHQTTWYCFLELMYVLIIRYNATSWRRWIRKSRWISLWGRDKIQVELLDKCVNQKFCAELLESVLRAEPIILTNLSTVSTLLTWLWQGHEINNQELYKKKYHNKWILDSTWEFIIETWVTCTSDDFLLTIIQYNEVRNDEYQFSFYAWGIIYSMIKNKYFFEDHTSEIESVSIQYLQDQLYYVWNQSPELRTKILSSPKGTVWWELIDDTLVRYPNMMDILVGMETRKLESVINDILIISCQANYLNHISDVLKKYFKLYPRLNIAWSRIVPNNVSNNVGNKVPECLSLFLCQMGKEGYPIPNFFLNQFEILDYNLLRCCVNYIIDHKMVVYYDNIKRYTKHFNYWDDSKLMLFLIKANHRINNYHSDDWDGNPALLMNAYYYRHWEVVKYLEGHYQIDLHKVKRVDIAKVVQWYRANKNSKHKTRKKKKTKNRKI